MDSVFQPSTNIDGLLNPEILERVLAVLSVGLTVTVIVLALQIVFIRIAHGRRERWLATLRARFKPLLFEAMLGPVSVELRGRGERYEFLVMLDETQRHITGEESDNLSQLARNLGLDGDALRYMKSRNLPRKLLGIRVLSRMGLKDVWPRLEALVKSGNRTVALAAAHALVRMDPQLAFAVITPVLIKETHWAPAAVVRILKDGGVHAGDALAVLLENAPASDAALLVRLLHQTQDSDILPVLRDRLHRTRDAEEIGELLLALGRLGTGDDRHAVLAHLVDPQWLIRLKAIRALGMIGSVEDRDVLVPLLTDREWWIRYRAAQALATLPGSNVAYLEALQAEQADGFAADILRQVIAEQAVA